MSEIPNPLLAKKPACPLPPDPKTYLIKPVPVAGPLTLHQLLLVISAACAGLAMLISYLLIIKHLHRYTEPKQQRQIIRIVFAPVFYAIVSCVSIISYDVTSYLQPLINLYESFALAALFLLFIEYVAPDEHTRTSFFSSLEKRERKSMFRPSKGYRVIKGGSQTWYERKRFAVFFFIVVQIVVFTTEDVSQATGKYCETSWDPKFAHLWVVILNAVFLAWAVMSILRFYVRMKSDPDFVYHKPGLKILSFKIIVAFNFFQNFVFGALTSTTMNGNDLHKGIPATIVAGEQVFFSLFFHYTFRSREYHESMRAHQAARRMGTFRAAADALNPMDLIIGVFTLWRYLPSVIGRKSFGKGGDARSSDLHLEAMSNQTSHANGWPTESSAPPTHKVTAPSAYDTSYTNVNGFSTNNNLAALQASHSATSDESSVDPASDGYRHEEERLNLARHGR